MLLKYAGIVIHIGEKGDDDREAYLKLASRSAKRFHEEDMEDVPQTSHLELAVLVIDKSKAIMKRYLEETKTGN